MDYLLGNTKITIDGPEMLNCAAIMVKLAPIKSFIKTTTYSLGKKRYFLKIIMISK